MKVIWTTIKAEWQLWCWARRNKKALQILAKNFEQACQDKYYEEYLALCKTDETR